MSDRERLIKLLSVTIHPRIGVRYEEVVADYLLDNDVAPVVHGHWVEAENGVCQCSVCKNDPWWKDNCVNPFKNWNYCPNCGAKMNGESCE